MNNHHSETDVLERTAELEKELAAKNRELQIEAALERVRARTMAMQKSDELADVASLLFKQVSDLGIKAWSSGFQIWNVDDISTTTWMSTPDGGIQAPLRLPHTEDPYFKKIYDARHDADGFFVMESKGKELEETYRYMFSIPEWKKAFGDIEDSGFPIPKFQITHCVFFPQGYLMFITYEPCQENWEIFKRFAKVFEQTYTRFLDLQKAEAQARESQVQLALERVRARTMAMQKSDELPETAAILFEQFKSLGQELMQMTIGIVNEADGVIEFSVTDWSGSGAGVNRAFNLSIEEPTLIKKMYNGWKENKGPIIIDLTGKELENWINYRNKMSGVTINSTDTSGRRVITSAFFSKGHLSFSTPMLPATGSIHLLERFAQVFDLTYTRFLDLKQAEELARESQIQLALERVRARTMAMQKSDELQEVVNSVYERFNELEVRMDGAAVCTFIEGTKDYYVWIGDYPEPLRIKFNEFTQVQRDYNDAIERREELFTKTYSGEMKKEYIHFLLEQTVLGINIPEEQKQLLLSSAFFTTSLACTKNTVFQLYRYAEKSFSKEENDILKRFANVFEQSYTRFLDLKKAEAQAKESQIELGLERVRARAMAMQKSDELSELVDTVFKELTKLDFALTWCIINIIDEPSLSNTVWAASPEIDKAPDHYHMKFEDYPFHHAMMKGWKERKTKYVYVLEGPEKKIYDDYLFNETEFRKVPEAAQAASRAMEKYVVSFSFSNFGGLQTVGDVPLSDVNLDILGRFGKVFDLTYTRFNDLKQAEAQARESQIQLALERVRARTMAMQRSDELGDAASLLFKQLQDLGVKSWSSGFNIWQDDGISATINMCNPDGSIATPYHLPHTEDIFFIRICEARQRGDDLLVMETGGKELEETYNYMFSLPEVKKVLGGMEDTGFQIPKFQVNHCAFFSQGYLMFITYEPVPEMWDVFKRFAKVFEQTYTRFLDLQKAEAQAREAKIEASLERVRSKAMAMHDSKDLTAAIGVFYQEIRSLSITPRRCGVGLLNKENRIAEISTMNTTEKGESKEVVGKLEMAGHPVLDGIYESTMLQKEYHPVLRGNEIKEYYKLVRPQIDYPDYPTDAVQYGNFFPFAGGSIFAWTEKELPEDELKIYRRFTSVLGLTYRRYKDLKEAEAQAREAQIEAALERVRSRSMGMQKSEELKEVIQVVYEQFVHLNIHIEHTGFIMDYKERDDMHIWLADKHEVPFQVTIPYFDCAHWNSFNEAREKGKDFFANHLSFEEKNKFYQDLFKLIPGVPEETLDYYFSCPGLAISTVLLENVGLYIENFSGIPYTDEENNTLMRFGKVFQQTYTRFLDLQKAEAQAREAQIEAALEKVRSCSLAMHTANELGGVVTVIVEKLKDLGVVLDANGVVLSPISRIQRIVMHWIVSPDYSMAGSYLLPYFDHPIFNAAWQSKENGDEYFSKAFSVVEKNSLFEYAFEQSD